MGLLITSGSDLTIVGTSHAWIDIAMMDKDSKIVIIGAGIFGLSTAYQLASEGYRNVVVLDRHMPPVSFLYNMPGPGS